MTSKLGDVVRLKSGGPKMTVTGNTTKDIWCAWFTEKGEPVRVAFPEEALQPVKEEGP